MYSVISRTPDAARVFGVVFIGALILLAPFILNGGPALYFDSATYIGQIVKGAKLLLGTGASFVPGSPETDGETSFGVINYDGIVIGGRSIYYGALAYLGWITSIWLPVAVQSFALAWLVVVLFRRSAPGGWAAASLLTLAGLTILTPAAFFAGLVMPDIWAGLAILALALLWGWDDDLTTATKLALFAILAFSAMAHNSHIALIAAFVAPMAGLLLFARRRVRLSRAAMAIPVAALACGIAGHVAFSIAIRTVSGAPAISRPHLSAHLVDLGPGARYARESCPESGFAVCGFVDRMPMNWITFLFNRGGDTGVFAQAPPDVQRALADEQVPFALATFASEPAAVSTGLLRDGLVQLWTLSMDDVALNWRNEDFLEENFPPGLASMTKRTFLYAHPEITVILTGLTQVVGAASVAALLVWTALRMGATGARPHERTDLKALDKVILICVAGLILNAMICGVLASPYGRFQARVAWIPPMLAALTLAAKLASGRRLSGYRRKET